LLRCYWLLRSDPYLFYIEYSKKKKGDINGKGKV